MRKGVVAVVILGIVVARGVALSRAQDGFPHRDHIGLFPTCVGCHSGIQTGDEPAYYSVTPADCVECHDGAREREVDWKEPARRITNLVFSHREHIEEVAGAGDTALACGSCHQIPGTRERMAVRRAEPESCVDCHAHEAREHLAADVRCGACHAPLAEAGGLPAGRIADFPEPASHEREDFLFEHPTAIRERGVEAESCAVCHARESCVRCHLNADQVPAIAELPADSRVANLVAGRGGEWPEPDDHERAEWQLEHGGDAVEEIGSCANCHAEISCRTCHGAAEIPVLAELPDPGPSDPAGVVIAAGRPPGHTPTFTTQHGSAVAANLPNCSSCHVERECATCHEQPLPLLGQGRPGAATTSPRPDPSAATEDSTDEGASAWRDAAAASWLDRRPGYHPANFVLRHGAEAFSAQAVCSDCHSTEAFCSGCHEGSGVALGAGQGALGAFHDAQPNWLLAHGQAARQGMEGCAGCHRQSSCLRCHSARFGLRISPHGPDFDPDRVAGRSTMSCGICHFASQIEPP